MFALRRPFAARGNFRSARRRALAIRSGEADLLIAPVQAALWSCAPEYYRRLALTIARDESIAHEDLVGFLAGAGYEKKPTCEMPGQFAVRGGIIDIFPPEALQPVRIELLGDTIESIRAFDPNTQRSMSPVQRATLLPLTEFVLGAEEFVAPGARSCVRAVKTRACRRLLSRLGISRNAAAGTPRRSFSIWPATRWSSKTSLRCCSRPLEKYRERLRGI